VYVPYLSKEHFSNNFYDCFFEGNILEIGAITKNNSQGPCQSLKTEVTNRKLVWSEDERAVS